MKKYKILFITLLITLILTACSMGTTTGTVADVSVGVNASTVIESITGDGNGSESAAFVPVESALIEAALAENEETHEDVADLVWDTETVVNIELNGDKVTVDGDGITVDGSEILISSPGTYSLNGSLADGQIVVDTDEEGIIRLILNGVDLRSSSSAPIDIVSAEETIIILADGTENFISDGASYVFDDPAEEEPDAAEPDAAVFSKADLTIYGSGSLTVEGNFRDGITSKDGLIIDGATITVYAVDDGIRGKDYLVMNSGNLTIQSGGDGLQSDNEEDAARGYILIEKGEIVINAGGDGINAQTDVMIKEGNITITTGGGSSYLADGSISTKGIKGTVSVNINGGTFLINSADDAVHSNGSIVINGGTFNIATADDGMHADSDLEINDGYIDITRSYEGIESAIITLNGGEIHIVSSDDGINVAGGADGSGFAADMGGQGMRPGGGGRHNPGDQQDLGGGMGQDSFTSSSDYHLYISGGYIVIDAAGDGIDSNGNIEMTDGVVLVNGPTEQMNGALDHAGFSISEGILVAAGSSGMAQSPDQSSSQFSVLIYFGTTQSAGTLVHIRDESGEEILTFAPTKAFQSIVFSTATLKEGANYSVYLGGSTTSTMVDGLAQDGTYSPGELYTSFSISGIVTMVGSGGRGGRSPQF